MPKKKKVETSEEEVSEVTLEPLQSPELNPGEYIREVNGVKYLAFNDVVKGVKYDLHRL